MSEARSDIAIGVELCVTILLALTLPGFGGSWICGLSSGFVATCCYGSARSYGSTRVCP